MLGFALDAVVEQANATKDAFASRKLWRPDGLADPSKVEEHWTFRNLLRAMYLQMYLLVALALALEADILTADKDFLGYGVSTWTVDTLISQLERRG